MTEQAVVIEQTSVVEPEGRPEACAPLNAAPAPEPAPLPAPTLLITITTPGCRTPICRMGTKQELAGDVSVRQLMERATSLRSPLSLGVPVAQLESEMSTLLAVGELLASGCAQTHVRAEEGSQTRVVPLDEPVHTAVRQEAGPEGAPVWTVDLEVRMSEEAEAMTVEERRQVQPPPVMEAYPASLVASASAAATEGVQVFQDGQGDEAKVVIEAKVPTPPTVGDDPAKNIVVIVGAPPAGESAPAEPKGYIRKTDLLRAQFLPEVEQLDLSGLFVGEFGAAIRHEPERRNVVLSDPARITEVLLRGNAFRRSGNHERALGCYQELVDMDPSNADFRFLHAKTLVMLGREEEAVEAFSRARELGHDGAKKELDALKLVVARTRKPLGFLRFWRQ